MATPIEDSSLKDQELAKEVTYILKAIEKANSLEEFKKNLTDMRAKADQQWATGDAAARVGLANDPLTAAAAEAAAQEKQKATKEARSAIDKLLEGKSFKEIKSPPLRDDFNKPKLIDILPPTIKSAPKPDKIWWNR
jgi:hypothetical protein